MRIDAITIFPDYFSPLRLSLIGRAIQDGLVDLRVHDLRNWTHDRHRTVDDSPYGGGAGMVMKPEPWGEALDALLASYRAEGDAVALPAGALRAGALSATGRDQPEPTTLTGIPAGNSSAGGDGGGGATMGRRLPTTAPSPADSLRDQPPTLIIPSPAGVRFTQPIAQELATLPRLAFACGRYEGIDARVAAWAAQHFEVLELSLGDYVLNGGEVAALVIIEAVLRLVPGVIGNPESLVEESHSPAAGGLLEYPVYTKPVIWRGYEVPSVLVSGDHGRVAAWRRAQSEELTRRRRPDLWAQHTDGGSPAGADYSVEVPPDGGPMPPQR